LSGNEAKGGGGRSCVVLYRETGIAGYICGEEILSQDGVFAQVIDFR